MNVSDLSAAQLLRAAALKERLEKLQKELTKLLGSATPAPAAPKQKKGKMSAAGLANIRAAQKARWAKVKAAARPLGPAPTTIASYSPTSFRLELILT